jgi:hypothetical protein
VAKKLDSATERKVRRQLAKGTGLLKTAKLLGLGTGTVQRISRELHALRWMMGRGQRAAARSEQSARPQQSPTLWWMLIPIVSHRLHEPFDLALNEVLAGAIFDDRPPSPPSGIPNGRRSLINSRGRRPKANVIGPNKVPRRSSRGCFSHRRDRPKPASRFAQMWEHPQVAGE